MGATWEFPPHQHHLIGALPRPQRKKRRRRKRASPKLASWPSKQLQQRTYLTKDLSHIGESILTFSFGMPFIINVLKNVSNVWKHAILYYFIPQNLLTSHILLKRSDLCISHGT